jgi:hypothetical protein
VLQIPPLDIITLAKSDESIIDPNGNPVDLYQFSAGHLLEIENDRENFDLIADSKQVS